MDANFAMDALSRCPLFERADQSMLASLSSRLRVRRFRRNEVIMHQGDPGDSLHIVGVGAVKIVLPSAEGEEAIIATLRPGDFFGELALIEEHPRTATVTAAEETECVLFVAWEFTALLKEYPQIAVPLFMELIRRTHRREHHMD